MCKKSYMFHIFIVFNIFWLKVNRLKAKKSVPYRDGTLSFDFREEHPLKWEAFAASTP